MLFTLVISTIFFNLACKQLIIQPVNYLIPAGYMGNIYIFHNVPDGAPLRQEGFTRIYEIPADGILRSQAPNITGATSNEYFYVTTDGKREKILGYWDSSSRKSR
jgi:hypothetical protein